MDEYKVMKDAIKRAVSENIPGIPEKEFEKAVSRITDTVMEAISENYRSITEVQDIVNAVRAGHKVEMQYYDPDENELDEMSVRACW